MRVSKEIHHALKLKKVEGDVDAYDYHHSQIMPFTRHNLTLMRIVRMKQTRMSI